MHLYGGASHGGGLFFLATACGHTGRDLSHRGEPLVPSGAVEKLRYLLVAVSVFTLASQGLAQGCAEWNTQEFFESATPYEVRAYLEAWSRVNARNPGDTTPLHFAASYNPDPAVIAVLLRAGADLNAREWLGRTPLHEAAWLNDNPAVITALVAVGANVNTRDDSGMTPLHTATQENFLSTFIEALLNAGADPSARGSEGRTPWALA